MEYDESYWTSERKARLLHGSLQGRPLSTLAAVYGLNPEDIEPLARQFKTEGIEPHQVKYHLDLEDARDE